MQLYQIVSEVSSREGTAGNFLGDLKAVRGDPALADDLKYVRFPVLSRLAKETS